MAYRGVGNVVGGINLWNGTIWLPSSYGLPMSVPAGDVGKVLMATATDALTLQSLPAGSAGLLQTASAELATDETNNTATFADLLSVSLTTSAGSRLIAQASFTGMTSGNGTGFFQMLLDGALLAGSSMQLTNNSRPQTGAIVWRTGPLSAASHTIALQWRGSGSIGLTIRPVTVPDGEHASLVVQEVRV